MREDDDSDKDDENQHEGDHKDVRTTSLERSMHWTRQLFHKVLFKASKDNDS